MARQENLAFTLALARQFDLFPSLEALDTLSDVELVRIRGMPFREFCQLIERLIEIEQDRKPQTPPHTWVQVWGLVLFPQLLYNTFMSIQTGGQSCVAAIVAGEDLNWAVSIISRSS